MELYSEAEAYKLYYGNMLDLDQVIEPNSIDSIVTDPPYGLTSIVKRFGNENAAPAKPGKDGSFARLSKGFMGKEWDGSGIEYNIDAWRKCYEVLKPGGYLLAFGGSRTFYRIACAIEDAGFEIRDTIMWLYGSGFPKALNIGLAIDQKNGVESPIIGKGTSGTAETHTRAMEGADFFGGEYDIRQAQNEWAGWRTALKPSFEPIIMARKPCDGSCTDNVLKYGVGGLNIDECRVGDEVISIHNTPVGTFAGGEYDRGSDTENYRNSVGRYPANTILTYDDTDVDEVCGGMPDTKSAIRTPTKGGTGGIGQATNFQRGSETSYFNDSGSAARYFYCAKASKKDRDEGLDELRTVSHPYLSCSNPRKNTHPTVKPTELMQYLIRLVTPKGGTVLDPFNGSGSTGKAVMYENNERDKEYKYIGIELTEEYLPIAKARIEYAIRQGDESGYQLRLF